MSSGSSQIWRRRSGTAWIRAGLVIFILVFIWLQLNFLSLAGSSQQYSEVNDSNAAILSNVPAVLHKFLSPRPKNFTITFSNGSYTNIFYTNAPNISEMKRNIAQYNRQQIVHNENIFEPLQNDSIVIVVQIHDRITYLRHLIVSLAQAPGISQALLVFSHDYYDEEMNSLVQSIDFCKVIQIFYPYSIQTHPNEFPGEDPDDCPRDIKKDQALQKKCNNALYPDVYGHYREAKFTQTKHHWWWKANIVFNQLEVTRNHTGLVVLLEEDHYVAEDFIHMLRLMERTYKESCKHCNILSLGTYLKTYNYYADSKKVEISPWISSKHNMGMAFNRSTWMNIVECASSFCKYDDYNWDWSLQHVSQNCLKHKLHAMVARAPRVFHIGECGVHHKKNNCKSTTMISKVQQILKSVKRHLYPDYLILTYSTVLKKTKLRKGNGGWGDRRDHKLCIGMTIGG
ncbi:alpha-1,6-mannosyl-glycoprotein 2-beta-N-acetylglucosaminyltransferase [Diorhabda sublineata]|uniref:alpha-1,6-mannosyl-glycoprotein 2-beta-N-acetylglucosaminyltransferase n=1 Tax=Diorhabda sublineata TaxID=1163346 RepID=UPI0024E04EA8|nr:alpha-1,6-mannosyl-glycoprotein 2-beta-N-acetylglucosaminyltransferase [Diorhabda sublineata]